MNRSKEISAVRIHVERMQNALTMNVDVPLNTKEIHTKDVDQNAYQILNVAEIELACAANVLTLALERVAIWHNAKL